MSILGHYGVVNFLVHAFRICTNGEKNMSVNIGTYFYLSLVDYGEIAPGSVDPVVP